ncbi:hypothetical protein ALQ33_01063 [Pseudomonas syringae pv. philadelphi]|uniref:Uncharacterized protein n=1 Tax=Pseudomonas syringae pv. philadelphi TaxID=251706 RepID=A0A3M3ZHI7_9PSED|nr:hypothetical protein [Pseudomonas syringae group genomosp. 3]RMO93539.1 hypothetical protein ALQ33_01063 [Pseudomonas syringae pv. philadelphi]
MQVNKESPAVVAFADGVSLENREAVMLSVAFAEQVAHKKADISGDPIRWLQEYSTAMRYSGWLTLGGHEYGEYTTRNQSLTMDAIVLEMIGAVAGPNKAVLIELLGLALDKLQKDQAVMALFERNSKKGNTSTFRIMPCVESAGGIPITYLLSMHCDYMSDSGGALFWKWSVSRMKVRRLVKGLNFDKNAHERLKPKILTYLNKDADDFFDSLN